MMLAARRANMPPAVRSTSRIRSLTFINHSLASISKHRVGSNPSIPLRLQPLSRRAPPAGRCHNTASHTHSHYDTRCYSKNAVD